MPGFTRRSKPLRAGVELSTVGGVSLSAPANGDLLYYDAVSGDFINGKTLPGSYVITGALTTGALTAASAVVSSTLNVTGLATLAGGIAVTGTTTLGALTAPSAVLSGNLTVGVDASITGVLTAATATIGGGGVSTTGALSVTGTTTLGVLVAGATTLSSTLDVAGHATIASGLQVTGAMDVLGTLNVTSTFTAPALSTGGSITGASLGISTSATVGTSLAVGTTLTAGTSVGVGSTAAQNQLLDGTQLIWYNVATELGRAAFNTSSLFTLSVGSPNETAITAAFNGAVSIYYDNVLTLATTATGVSVTSTVTSLANFAAAASVQIGPTSGINLAVTTSLLQARNNGAKSQLTLNQLGGVVQVGQVATTAADDTVLGGVTVTHWGTLNNAPSTGGTQAAMFRWANTGGAIAATAGFETGTILYIRNKVKSGNVVLSALNASSVDEQGFAYVPGGAGFLYYAGAITFETISGGTKTTGKHQITGNLEHSGSNVGFYGTAAAAKPTVTGSRGGNAALASLLTALAGLGLLTDSSTV